MLTPPQGETPLHMHHREEQSFFILEGDYDFYVNDRMIRIAVGSFIVVPRLIPYRYQNVGDAPARMLVIARPAGVERFFDELARLISQGSPGREKVMTLIQRYGIEYLTPLALVSLG